MIFPEGTRRPPGAPPDYKPGFVALYEGLGLPCVPLALNSGLFWPRRSIVRYPGTIVIEILDPIPPGLPRAAGPRPHPGAHRDRLRPPDRGGPRRAQPAAASGRRRDAGCGPVVGVSAPPRHQLRAGGLLRLAVRRRRSGGTGAALTDKKTRPVIYGWLETVRSETILL